MSRLIAILGPTASGKSALAMAIAKRINGEIIACDAMTVYRGLDIGTAKASIEDQALVPHHLIDVIDPGTPYDAAKFVSDAQQAIESCKKRNVPAVLCGGSGLYARSLLYQFDPLPSDPSLAATIRAQYETDGIEPILAELAEIDPGSAKRTQENPRRVMRALEAARLLEGPIPTNRDTATPAIPCHQVILMPDAESNRRAIAARADEMLESGWLEETKELVARGFLDTPTAKQAIGYGFIADFLAGKRTRESMLERITIATSRYAKRQRTWFRNQHPGATVIAPPTAADLEATTEQIIMDWQSS